MSDRTFIRLLVVIAVTGVLVTLAHAVYICFAYQNSSIIQFIARELWL